MHPHSALVESMASGALVCPVASWCYGADVSLPSTSARCLLLPAGDAARGLAVHGPLPSAGGAALGKGGAACDRLCQQRAAGRVARRGARTAGAARAAAAESPYEVLGVRRGATDKEIKQAYRKKALKLHPDVNKAPDAQAQFLRVKVAYQALTEKGGREDYERAQRNSARGGGAGGPSWADSFDPFASWSKPRGQPEEDFYGLNEFFRDLQNDWDARRVRSQPPKSLLEELADIGGEFVEGLVEYLEKSINLPPLEEEEKGKAKSTSSSSGGGGSSSGGGGGSSSSRSSSSSSSSGGGGGSSASSRGPGSSGAKGGREQPHPAEVEKSLDEEVEDMLAKLKRDMGL